jgi:hypothetical protein
MGDGFQLQAAASGMNLDIILLETEVVPQRIVA